MSQALKAGVVSVYFLLSLLWVGGTPLSRDGDTWFHWASGEVQTQAILDTRSISRGDDFSYTAAGQPRELHSWLGQILIAQIAGLGDQALLVLRFCLWLGLLSLLLGTKPNRGLSPAAWFFIMISLYATLRETGDLRPSLLGALFVYGFCAWALRGPFAWSWRNQTVIFFLGVLAVNLHGSGLLLALLGLALTLVNRRHWPLVVILGLASLVNPRGIGVWKEAYQLALAANLLGVGEWQSFAPVSFTAGNLVVRISLLHLIWWGTSFVLCWRLKREGLQVDTAKRGECLVSLLFVLGPLVSLRHLLFLPLATAIQIRWLFLSLEAPSPRNPKVRIAMSFAGLSLIALMWPEPANYLLPKTQIPIPLKAMSFLKESKLSGNAFNELTWAGQILRASQGKIRVALDCQVSLHRENFRRLREIEKAQKTIGLKSIAQLFPETNILIHRTDFDWGEIHKRDWITVFQNDVATISLKKTAANEENFSRVIKYYRASGLEFDRDAGIQIPQVWRMSKNREELFEVRNQTQFSSPAQTAQMVLRRVEWLARNGLWEAATDLAKQNLASGVWSTALAVRMGSLLLAQQRFPEAKQWVGFLATQEMDTDLIRPLRLAIGRWEHGNGWGEGPKYLFAK